MGVDAACVVFTNERDISADLVVRALSEARVSVLRCNTERLDEWALEVVPGLDWRLEDASGRRATAGTTSGVWWRRPAAPSRPSPKLGQSMSDSANEQWQAALEGLATVEGPTWVSSPSAITASEEKGRQLALAAECGFTVPRTILTTDAHSARAFVREVGGHAIAKSAASAYWEDNGVAAFVYATTVTTDELPDERLGLGVPVVLQEKISSKRDVRVTVVGTRTFGAIASHTTSADWRTDRSVVWASHDLPGQVADACIALVTSSGLRFSGIDLLIDSRGQYWFLEANPNGEWAWLDRSAGLPIAAAIAQELIG